MAYITWGIRFDDREFNIGDEITKSARWDGGIMTDELLSGTCAIFVSDETDFLDYLDGVSEADYGELDDFHAAMSANYSGKNIYLVAIDATWGYEWGEDEGEIIMNGAEVVRKLN